MPNEELITPLGYQPTSKFWVSWFADPVVAFDLSMPWWVSGYRDNTAIICAAVKAADETAAMELVNAAHDSPVDIEWRFLEQREQDWSPFNGRFPKAEWMEW